MKNKRALQTLLAVCFWLAVWQIAAMAMQQEFLLASPLRVLQRLVALAGTHSTSAATPLFHAMPMPEASAA